MSDTNGITTQPPEPAQQPAKSSREQLREARAELALMKTRMQVQFLKQQEHSLGLTPLTPLQEAKLNEIRESTSLYPGWPGAYGWDGYNPWVSFATQAGQMPLPPYSSPSDRAHGQNRPFFVNEQQLNALRQASRWLCKANGYAKGALRNACNYVIHTGFKFNLAAADETPTEPETQDADPTTPGKQKSDPVQDATRLGQKVIDWFCKENKYYSRQREAYRRIKRDGEYFHRFFPQPDTNLLLVRWIEPEQIQGIPEGQTTNKGWSFGIQHQMNPVEDIETKLAYHVVPMDLATAESGTKLGKIVPADEVQHVTDIDEDSTVARGMPAFVYDVAEAFERASKLQRNLSQGGALQAAIAWIEQHETATRAQVNAYQAGQADVTYNDPLTGKVRQQTLYPPGTIPKIPKGKEFVQPPYNAGAGSQQEIVQGDLRGPGTAFCMPEYMISGDAGNSNYASTKETGAPFVRNIEAEQAHMAEAFEVPVRRQLDLAIKSGVVIDGENVRLPADFWQLVKLQTEPPIVIQRDPLQQTQKLVSEVQAKLTSPQTAQMELGRDPEIEAANWAEWDERNGGGFGGLPFGLPGEDPLKAGPGETEQPFGGFTEAVLQEAGFTGTITDKLGRKIHYQNGVRVRVSGEQGAEPTDDGPGESVVDRLDAIKARADELQPSDDASGILAEVDSALSGLSAKEVIALAKQYQSWDVTSKKEAIEKIKRKVLEMQRARSRIEF